MQRNRAQEQFSFAYITAVASQAQIQVEIRRLDDDGVDGQFISDQGSEPRIEFQAKSTSLDIERPSHLAYPLKVGNHDSLIKRTTTPRILIVTIVPHNIDEWLSQNTERLLTRRCSYWHILRGEDPTGNHAIVTVDIPKEQILSPQALTELIAKADLGELDD